MTPTEAEGAELERFREYLRLLARRTLAGKARSIRCRSADAAPGLPGAGAVPRPGCCRAGGGFFEGCSQRCQVSRINDVIVRCHAVFPALFEVLVFGWRLQLAVALDWR